MATKKGGKTKGVRRGKPGKGGKPKAAKKGKGGGGGAG